MSNVIPLKPGAGPEAGAGLRRILMVEDNANDAELLRAYLADACRDGAEILHARSLAEGLELQRQHEPQLTLLDLDLPDSSGFHTLERMRAVAAGPVVVISGNGHPMLVEEALKRRAYDVIPKHELDAATLRRVLRLATLHHEASRAQRATEGRFRALLENSAEALVLFDAAGRIEYASASMYRVLGYEPAAVVGRNGLAFVLEEDREKVQAAFPRLVANPGSSVTMRVRFVHKESGARVLESTLVNRLGDADVAAIVCSFRDLTQEEEQRSRFDATFENAAVGLAHVDLEGRVLLANRRLCEMFGYTPQEMVGRTIRDLSHPEDIDATAHEREQLRTGAIPQFSKRKRYLRKDGGTFWVQLTVAVERDARGAPLYEIAAIEDISETMRAERRGERLARMYAALSATNEAILKAEDAPTLYRRVCELLVAHGSAKLAAVRLVDPATKWIEAVARAGEPASYLEKARVSVDPALPNAHGPAAKAVREGRTVVNNDYLADPMLALWHAVARESGIGATMSVPLRRGGAVVGLITLYAAETGWFDPELVGLAERMVQNVSFALDSLDRDAALRASEQRFRSLTELGSDWFWEQDAEYRFTRFDGGQGNEKWGGDQSQSLGLRRWEIAGLVPLSATWEEHRALLDARRPFRGFEYMRVLPDGSRRYVTSSGTPVFDGGRFVGYRGTAADITQEKSAEERARLEHRMAQHLAEAQDARAGLRAVIQDICQSEGWDCGRYFAVDEAAGVLRYHDGWGVDDPEVQRFLEASRPMVQARGAGIAGQVWQSGTPLWVADIRKDARVSALGLAVNGEMRGAFVFPVTVQSQVLGVLSIAGRNVREPDQALLDTTRTIGSQVGLFLSRQRAEEATRESEARFRSLTTMSSDFFWETDAHHRFTLRGEGARPTAVAAFRNNGMLGKTRWELPHLKPDAAGWAAHRAELDAHRPFRDFEFSRIGTEGEERFIVVSGDPVFDAQGNFAGYRGVGTDITQRKLAERRLRLEHDVLQALAAATGAQAGIEGALRVVCEAESWDCGRYFEADAQAGLLRFAGSWGVDDPEVRRFVDATRTMTHRPGEGVRGIVWQTGEPAWVDDARVDARVAPQALATLGDIRGALVVPVTAGAAVLGVLSISSRVMRKPDERLLQAMRVIGSQLGQFLQKVRSAQALRDSEERFRNLTELSSDWYWEQDAEFRFTKIGIDSASSVYAAEANVLGKKRWELPLTPLGITWEQHQETLRAHRTFRDFEYSHAGADGGLRYFSASGYPVFDAEGRFQGYRGIAKDVTARYQAREELRLSFERFEVVSRATNDVVWDWNLVSDELWWNENFQNLFGYTREEVGPLSDSWTSRIHPEDVVEVKARVRNAIDSGAKVWTGEYRFRHKDGSYLDVYDRGLVMHDAQGRPVRMIGAMMDVSERKHAEERMRVHAERQAAVARFGQFALGRRSVEELYTEAARALHCTGVDAVCLLEMHTERREFLVRAAHGEGPHASVGLTGPMAPDSVWPDILRENAPRIAGRRYLSERPLDRPWRAWLRKMGSAVYAPVRDDEKPIAMLCMYAVREHAFGAEDVRFAEAVSHVLSTALQRQKAEERLARMAQFDALTGLPNRTLLQDRLGQTIVQSRRRQLHAGVLFVDLDRFKLINDTLGHHQGDVLIRQVGQRLLACVRPGDTVGRISGDEFAVVLADMARPDDAALVGQKILEALAVPFDLGGNEAYVTGSIGIAVYPSDGDNAETLLKNADMAMYRAKESARNSYCFFTSEMNQRSVAKVQLNADLRHALERAEFALHYQPKVDLKTGQLRGLEALLRWNHPSRGLVSPLEFVPALEDSGLIIPVGEWVIAEACAQVRRWQIAGLAPVPVAVNLSAKQFLRRDLDGAIQRALAAAGVPAQLLELEITESSLMDNPEEAVRAMNALRAAGLRISVDDFGTGYSSLAYLARFPLSALKIDRAFVKNVHEGASDAAIVRAVIDMANNLGLQVIAEGVETEAQADFLRRHGCHQAQGYLYSRPLPAGEIARRLLAA